MPDAVYYLTFWYPFIAAFLPRIPSPFAPAYSLPFLTFSFCNTTPTHSLLPAVSADAGARAGATWDLYLLPGQNCAAQRTWERVAAFVSCRWRFGTSVRTSSGIWFSWRDQDAVERHCVTLPTCRTTRVSNYLPSNIFSQHERCWRRCCAALVCLLLVCVSPVLPVAFACTLCVCFLWSVFYKTFVRCAPHRPAWQHLLPRDACRLSVLFFRLAVLLVKNGGTVGVGVTGRTVGRYYRSYYPPRTLL